MTATFESVREQAMSLPNSERRQLGEELVYSVPEPSFWEQLDLQTKDEIKRRIEDIKAGREELLDGEDVLEQLLVKYTK